MRNDDRRERQDKFRFLKIKKEIDMPGMEATVKSSPWEMETVGLDRGTQPAAQV